MPSAWLLVLNHGSSSLKFAGYALRGLDPVFRGSIDGIGGHQGSWRVTAGETAVNKPARFRNHGAALRATLAYVEEEQAAAQLAAVGHRIVHGGPRVVEHALVSSRLLQRLRDIQSWAPSHLPMELDGIEMVQRRWARLPQVVCLDTAFHRHLPSAARLLPLPRRYEKRGIRRYGFHGLSYEYLWNEYRNRIGTKAATQKLVIAHLGHGASLAAVKNGRSVDTTMGFTPAAGLVMSTRTGDLDPGVAVYLQREEKLSAGELERLVNNESGLKGVSGTSDDTRVLQARAKTDQRAAEALELFCYQARKHIAAMAAAMDGLDSLIFSGGIGENSSSLRAQICAGLSHLGVAIDVRLNRSNAAVVSAPRSRVTVHVIRTDEERQMAKIVARLLARRRAAREPLAL